MPAVVIFYLIGYNSIFLSHASKLGEQMADLHLYNQKLRDKSREQENTVGTSRCLCAPLTQVALPWTDTHGDLSVTVELHAVSLHTAARK